MSWMKLNEGLSSLKGQISNFASNVLADDEDSEVKTSEFEQLKQLCVQQNLEIDNLRALNEKLQNGSLVHQSRLDDVVESNGSWNWDAQPANTVTDQEDTISYLKTRISLLENEKNDVLGQLEQLDSENQENLAEVVAMKEKLQDELNDLKEDYEKIRVHNKHLTSREAKLKSEESPTLAEENQKLKTELVELQKQLQLLDRDFKIASANENMDTIRRLEDENKVLASHLQNATEKNQVYEKKSLEDEDNCHKLAVILETYEKQVSTLKEELERLKTENQCSRVEETERQLKSATAELEELKLQVNKAVTETNSLQDLESNLQALRIENNDLRRHNEELQRQVSSNMDIDLEEELDNIKAEHAAQLNLLEQEMDQLRTNEAKNSATEEQLLELEGCIKTLKIEIGDLEEQNKELAALHERVMAQLHDQYVNIITENIKKFQECEKPSDFQHCSYQDDPQVADFSKQVENIMKILLDLKCKCQTLENKVMDLSEEKTGIQVEKNHEIEKLMHHSEILSQEVLRKTQEIKECEKECSELATNNDLLIADLEAYKNNSVLQTISESNEDNMVLLESQLENANRRIEDLEKIIDDCDRERLGKESSAQENVQSTMEKLLIERDALKSDLEASRDYLQVVNHDKSDLKSSLEKVTSDYDNLEYQISELNVNNDSLKEEIVVYNNKIDDLLKENSKMKFLIEEYESTNDELKSRLGFTEKKLVEEEKDKVELEQQIRTFTEKLQISKMAETSLKLHCEQKSKEVAALSEANYNLEVSLNQTKADLLRFQTNFDELQSLNDSLSKEFEELKTADGTRREQIKHYEEQVEDLSEKLENSADHTACKENQTDNTDTAPESNRLVLLEAQLTETLNNHSALQQQLQEITNSRNELINLITTKHQESITYHNEIQRLTQILTAENEKYRNLETHFNELKTKTAVDVDGTKLQLEKLTDQNSFLKEKCEVLAKNLLEEQSKVHQFVTDKSLPSEKEVALQKKLDRLQSHLVELEEHYTQELFQAEQKNAALQARVADIEEREKNSSTLYTSVSIRANQQVESLQKQLQAVVNERDGLRKQISDAEDQGNKQAAALANLQFVLEQFRKDKEKDVHMETERIRRQIAVEKQVQEELKNEIAGLKSQLDESNQGLQAASRLSDQLENTKKSVSMLRDEVSGLQTKLSKAEEDLQAASSQTNEKVDKSLVKNLVIGFVTSNNNLNKDQTQILKIIATVLDFNQQDHDKVNLNKPHTGSWLGSFLVPDHSAQNKLSAESLSQAFVKFLENESKPRAIPNLLNSAESSEATKTTSDQSSPRQAPIVLSEIVLPTFTDFAQNRNSSSILKDVLKDNS